MKKLFAFLLAAFLLTTPVLASAGPDSRSADPAACAHHFQVSVVREATCSQKGLLAYTCAKCGLTYTAETLPDEDAHQYELTDCTATCTEDGENVYTCALCGDSYTEPAPAAGHTPGEPAGCTDPVICAVCGALIAPPAGHDYVYQYDAQFDEEGALTDYGTWKCSVCGDTMPATRGNAEQYYGLEPQPAQEEDDSGTDLLVVGSELYGDDASPTDGEAVPAAAQAGDDSPSDAEADSPSDAEETAPAQEEDSPSDAEQAAAGAGEDAPGPRTELWIAISAAALAVIVVETVALTRSIRKNKTTL